MGCTACTEPQCLYKGSLCFLLYVKLLNEPFINVLMNHCCTYIHSRLFSFHIPSLVIGSKMRLKISRYKLLVNVLYRFNFQSRFVGVDFVNKFMLNISCFSLLPCRLFPHLFYRYVTSIHLVSNVIKCFQTIPL